MTDFPTPDMALTHILVVSDLERSRRWYADVLGATLYREYGGSSAVLQFNEAWLLIVTGGGPTPDKPSVTLAAPADPDRPDHLFTIRVDDCRATYEALKAKGVEFIEEPEERFYGVDAAFRDPFGNHWRLTQPKPLDQIRHDVVG